MDPVHERQKNPRSKQAGVAVLAMMGVFLLREGVMVTRPDLPLAPIAEPQPFLQSTGALPEFVAEAKLPVEGQTSSFHQTIPQAVRGIYLSAFTAGSKSNMDRILSLLATADLNTVVIDIKDASGRLSYQPLDPELEAIGVGTRRIADLPALITTLHEKRIYVIGRISVFQDPFFANAFPEESFKDGRTGELWRDYKSLPYLRPDSEKTWEYTARIARDAYTQGFDEINLDYVRYPSDGDLFAMLERPRLGTVRAATLESFFSYLDTELRQENRIPISADLFGLTMSSRGDIGIGQILEVIAPHVDYVCPMVYPSHYAAGSYGIVLPASRPHEIISRSLADGLKRLEAIGIPKERLRPWLQDFNLGADYTPEMVAAQIQGANELGIYSWTFWDPKNIYASTKAATVKLMDPLDTVEIPVIAY